MVLTEPPPVPAEPQGEAIALTVVYEDDDLIVIDKPAGLVVHPAAGHETGTLVNALIAHCGASLSGIGGVRRPGIVHRLDKDTTGLLVVAKNDRGPSGPRRAVRRSRPHGPAGAGLSGPGLGRARAARTGRSTPPSRAATTTARRSSSCREGSGREAITHYTVDGGPAGPAQPVASLVRCPLETGRTHQIRVHMAHLGHPLLGDAVYGVRLQDQGEPARCRRKRGPRGARAAGAARRRAGLRPPAHRRVLRFESPLPRGSAALLDGPAARPC